LGGWAAVHKAAHSLASKATWLIWNLPGITQAESEWLKEHSQS
jgi:hypothetical protein